jgi:hypothetical protein
MQNRCPLFETYTQFHRPHQNLCAAFLSPVAQWLRAHPWHRIHVNLHLALPDHHSRHYRPLAVLRQLRWIGLGSSGPWVGEHIEQDDYS